MVTADKTSPTRAVATGGRSPGEPKWWQRGRGTAQTGPWRDLGYSELANTVRRICTLCGWANNPDGVGRSLAVTSAVAREGKSSIARAVAISTAQDHAQDVLLLECDLLDPNAADEFGTEGGPGLADLLTGTADLDEVLRPTALPNLWLLPAGGRHDNPSRLLRSTAMAELLSEVRERFAYVVVDLPAVLKSSDAAVLARQTDGAVLVVRAASTDQRAIQQALQLLSGAALHGVVLNRGQSKLPDIVRRIVEL